MWEKAQEWKINCPFRDIYNDNTEGDVVICNEPGRCSDPVGLKRCVEKWCPLTITK